MTRILVTGAGGPAAICFLRSVQADNPDIELLAADMDPCAAGLYLVSHDRRYLIPRGDSPEFVDAMVSLCEILAVDLLVPTVDAELLPLARRREELLAVGTEVMLPPTSALEACLDKATLIERLRGVVPVPETVVLDAMLDIEALRWPRFAKPRRGSGSRGIRQLDGPEDLAGLPRDGSYIVQEHLPGAEYSVDVCLRRDGSFVAAVPRARLKVDSGVAVTATTVADPLLGHLARLAAVALGLTYTVNVQLKRDAAGHPRLLEINPRFPGTMALTVAAGIDMPVLCVREALGRAPLPCDGSYRHLAMVRTFQETFFSPAELDAVRAFPSRSVDAA